MSEPIPTEAQVKALASAVDFLARMLSASSVAMASQAIIKCSAASRRTRNFRSGRRAMRDVLANSPSHVVCAWRDSGLWYVRVRGVQESELVFSSPRSHPWLAWISASQAIAEAQK